MSTSETVPLGGLPPVDNDSRLYNFLGGIQVKNNSTERRLKPFAHALVDQARNPTSAWSELAMNGLLC